MAPVMIRIDDNEPMALAVSGFTSSGQAHRHLFKHVVRVCALSKDALRSHEDPERWENIIDDPPLKASLEGRRRDALGKLEGITGCALGRSGKTPKDPCKNCTHSEAKRRVDAAVHELVQAYCDVAFDAFVWGLEHPSRSRPRLYAHRERGKVKLVVVDERHVKAVGVFTTDPSSTSVVTCHRMTGEQPLRVTRLRLARESAGHRRSGSYVSLELDRPNQES